MNQVQYGGSWYLTVSLAAKAWACTALPDVCVIGADEDAEEAARGLEDFWWTENQKVDQCTPDGVEEDVWRAACREALTERIEKSRAA